MNKKLHIIVCVEDLPRFVDEVTIQLYNFEKYDLSKDCRIIVFLPSYKPQFSVEWKKVEKIFPNTKFFYYSDKTSKITDLVVDYNYIPIHRLFSLEKHFKDFPELSKDTTLYLDSDVIFTQSHNIPQECINDEINYLSDTHTYLNEKYFSGKIKDVLPERLEEFEKLDVVDRIASFAGITKDILRENNNSTGGAQYLLKNLNSRFFSECIDICLLFRQYLQAINQRFFKGETPSERESNGYQSWVADMAAIQWNLWRHKLPSETPKWMDFAWATDKVEKLQDVFMLHNAGVSSDDGIRVTDNLRSIKDKEGKSIVLNCPAYWKGNYKLKSVFNDMPILEEIVNHPISSQYCTAVYAQEIINTYNNLIKNNEKLD